MPGSVTDNLDARHTFCRRLRYAAAGPLWRRRRGGRAQNPCAVLFSGRLSRRCAILQSYPKPFN